MLYLLSRHIVYSSWLGFPVEAERLTGFSTRPNIREMSVASPNIGQVFGHYRLLEQIGAGGMGVVFRALDEQLQRDVALKVLPPGLFGEPARRERFRREALAVGRLNHPNIAMAFDFGEENGVDYLVTEYIPGVGLDEKIGGQPLPQKTVLELGLQMVSGLEAAHRAGVIHRDLKPGNIRLTRDEQLKLLDFGLAKMTGPIDASAQTATLDSELSASGTLPYMAPELLQAQPTDVRADIWAAGAVLYEMATGKRAFPDKQPSLVIDAILHYDPVRPTLINPNISQALEAVILKALDRDPERRYQSARELRVDLARILAGDEVATDTLRHSRAREFVARARRRKITTAVAMLLLAAIAIGFAARRWRLQRVPQRQKILAVLPIEAVGQDAATGALGLGLTETLTAKLEQASDNDSVQVVSPRDLRDQQVKTADDARREFGTDYVLESSLQRSGPMIRVNCYLVDSITHRQLAARTIETRVGDSFGLQDQVVNAVLDMLPGKIEPAQRQALAARQDTQPAAYEAYIQGRGYLQEYEKPENIDNAIAAFNQALKIDPNYAPAYAARGEANWIGFQQFLKGNNWMDNAARDCEKALSLNKNVMEGHVCLGNVLNSTGKYGKAAEQFQSALALNPQNEDALRGLAGAYTSMGNLAGAEAAYKRAIASRPNYWGVYHWLGLFYYSQGRYPEAVQMFLKTTELAPDNYRGFLTLGGAYGAEGRFEDAIDAFKRSIDLLPSSDAYTNLGYAYFLLHRYSESIAAQEQAIRLNDSHWEYWGNLGDALYWSPQRRGEAGEKYRKAITIALSRIQINPRDAETMAYIANYEAMLDDRDTAFTYLRRALSLAPNDGEVLFRAAVVYNHFKQTDEALGFLHRAAAVGYSRAIIEDSPDFDPLQRDPRFLKLLHSAP